MPCVKRGHFNEYGNKNGIYIQNQKDIIEISRENDEEKMLGEFDAYKTH